MKQFLYRMGHRTGECMKKVLVFVYVLSLLAIPVPALADPPDGHFSRFFTVDSLDPDPPTEQNVFNWDQIPQGFGQIGGVGANRHAHVRMEWFFNSTLMDDAEAAGASGVNDFRLTPPDWNTVKQPGLWTLNGFFDVFADVDHSLFKSGSDTYSFTVTPEPVSMALFGLGAGALGLASRFRKKKK